MELPRLSEPQRKILLPDSYSTSDGVGYNVGFDIDMLQAEFQRAGLAPLEVGGKLVVDAYRLWQRMEPRGLQQAHQRFVGRAFAGAHRGPGDVAATAAVLGRMIAAFGLEGAAWSELAALCARREG